MICTSFTFRGEEYLAWPRPIDMFVAGHATAIPPLHPWSNRLGAWEYDVGDVRVDLEGLALPVDGNGLPIHGNLLGVGFEQIVADPDRLIATLDYGAYPEKLRAFPFPHLLTIDAQ